MTALKPKRGAHVWRVAWFYAVIACTNLLLTGLVLAVTRPAPLLAVAPHFAPYTPPRVITKGIPVHITVPSVAINLPIQIGSYDPAGGTWTIDTSHAFYANLSVPVNDNNGTTLIYSHARAGLFGSLPDIQPGASAIVSTDTGYLFHYTYQSSVQVDPSATDVLAADTAPTLLLQTCIGDWSQYRALYSFRLTSVSNV